MTLSWKASVWSVITGLNSTGFCKRSLSMNSPRSSGKEKQAQLTVFPQLVFIFRHDGTSFPSAQRLSTSQIHSPVISRTANVRIAHRRQAWTWSIPGIILIALLSAFFNPPDQSVTSGDFDVVERVVDGGYASFAER